MDFQTEPQFYELSYYIPRIHISVTENDVKDVINTTTFDINYYTSVKLNTPSRIDFVEIPNNSHFKAAFVYHEFFDTQGIELAKKVEYLIKVNSDDNVNKNSQNKKLNLKINCSILTPNNPNAYWILLPNHNKLSENGKLMADQLKSIGDNIVYMLYILSHGNVIIPSEIDIPLEEENVKYLTPSENENYIASKLENAIQTKEQLENLIIQNNLLLPNDLDILYRFEYENDVINTYLFSNK
jgi:hypothetical protein